MFQVITKSELLNVTSYIKKLVKVHTWITSSKKENELRNIPLYATCAQCPSKVYTLECSIAFATVW